MSTARPRKRAPRSLGGLAGGVLLLLAITLVAYLPAFRAGFVWDDDMYVTDNLPLRSLDGLRRIWFEPNAVPQYYPLAYTTFWVEYQTWELNPVGYHAVNVALHSLNAVLAWLVFRRLGLRAAWFAAALFALHPVNVESVAWITERKNVLSGVFYLLTILAYFRFRPLAPQRPEAGTTRWGAGALALLAFLAALLSKTATCSLPAALLLVIWWKDTRLSWRDVWPTLPFFALALGLSLVTYLMETHHVGAEGPQWAFSLPERGLIAARALCTYATKLLWPANLAFVYPRWPVDAHVWWQYLFPAAVLALFAGLWRTRRRCGNGPLAAALFYAGTLFPVLGFLNYYYMRYAFIADHFQYLASLGLLALVAEAAAVEIARLGPATRRFIALPATFVLLTLAVLTARQCQIYRDIETLWRDTLTKNPSSAIVNNNLGGLLRMQGHSAEAVPYLEAALRVYPDDVEYLCNLGNAYTDVGRFDDAHRVYTAALQIDPMDYISHYGLGTLYGRMQRDDEAVRHLRRALEINPDYVPARDSLTLLLSGRAGALVRAGQTAAAIAGYRECLRLAPDRVETLNRLAWLLATDSDAATRSGNEAVSLAERASQLTKYQEPSVLDTLAAALAESGQFERAVEVGGKALELARQHGAFSLAEVLAQRVRLYTARTPYHEPATR